ncbi:Hypothetical_protein [Hexamita inflata]|uniref:Hypothetical_protein n=1 Tax=Hexamita inflata TaxID=28002 RepID=A0AA86N3Z5_9EUKA|nr:Hypothetical protein HINF_LOCUS232 [Hexamita inflata]
MPDTFLIEEDFESLRAQFESAIYSPVPASQLEDQLKNQIIEVKQQIDELQKQFTAANQTGRKLSDLETAYRMRQNAQQDYERLSAKCKAENDAHAAAVYKLKQQIDQQTSQGNFLLDQEQLKSEAAYSQQKQQQFLQQQKDLLLQEATPIQKLFVKMESLVPRQVNLSENVNKLKQFVPNLNQENKTEVVRELSTVLTKLIVDERFAKQIQNIFVQCSENDPRLRKAVQYILQCQLSTPVVELIINNTQKVVESYQVDEKLIWLVFDFVVHNKQVRIDGEDVVVV